VEERTSTASVSDTASPSAGQRTVIAIGGRAASTNVAANGSSTSRSGRLDSIARLAAAPSAVRPTPEMMSHSADWFMPRSPLRAKRLRLTAECAAEYGIVKSECVRGTGPGRTQLLVSRPLNPLPTGRVTRSLS
jgi:hypothetical protein